MVVATEILSIIQIGDFAMANNENYKYLDPKIFTEEDLPVIVCCDDLRGFIGWAIKDHTSGNYNHAFLIHKPGMCVSQDFTGFREKSIDLYLTPGQMLKFWRIKNLTDIEKSKIQLAITKRLAFPWWRRSYDFLGTFIGQFTGLRFIQNPFQEFCSEEVNDDYIKSILRASIMKIQEPSPTDLNNAFNKNPDLMECLGFWWSD